MHERTVHGVKHFLKDTFAAGDSPHRHKSTRKRLGHTDQIRLYPPMIDRPETSRASESRLYLVDYQKCPVAATKLGRTRKIIVARDPYAVALNRLDNKRGDIARA